MRKVIKWSVLFFLFFPAAVAFGNPVIMGDPLSDFAYIMVIGSTLGAEVAVTTIFLFFCHMSPTPVFLALMVGNLAVYFGFFVFIIDEVSSLWAAELLIVVIEAFLIKLISSIDMFQLETFTRLKWRYAFIGALIGNVVSYYVGTVVVV